MTFLDYFLKEKVAGYREEQLTLASGKKTHWYVNGRVLSQTLERVTTTADFVVKMLEKQGIPKNLDAVLGVPEGAVELGNAVSRALIKKKKIKDKLYVLRKTPKEHGDPVNKFWVTGQIPKRVIIIEDTTTTASSLFDKLYVKLIDSGVQVVGVVALVNREQRWEGKTVEERCKEHKLPYTALLRARDILPRIIDALPKNTREKARAQLNAEYVAEYAPDNSPFAL
jgi:orotate phosphoribosyltransferase